MEAEQKECRCVKILTDLSELVRACKNNKVSFDISSIVQDIKLMCGKFLFYEIHKIDRREVHPAHNALAIKAREGGRLSYFVGLLFVKKKVKVKQKIEKHKCRTLAHG